MRHVIYILVLVAMISILSLTSRPPTLKENKPTFDDEPTSVRPNLVGWVSPKTGGATRQETYFSLKNLGEKYGLQSKGSGVGADKYGQWQIAVFCVKNLTAHFSIPSDNAELSFQIFSYGFKRPKDYESFKSESMAILKKYGTFYQVSENPILSIDVLKQKEKMYWRGEDLTSQCEGGK